jgi:hypothetical protein
MIKKDCDTLRIVKNKRVMDRDKSFNYIFEWRNGNTLVIKEIIKVMANEYYLPVEQYDIADMIEHKKHCCLNIDQITVEEVEI